MTFLMNENARLTGGIFCLLECCGKAVKEKSKILKKKKKFVLLL